MSSKPWKQTVEKGICISNPEIALYQASMEAAVPDISKNPTLFIAANKHTSGIYNGLVAFDAALAQVDFDRGDNILCATIAGETLLPISANPDFFKCRFCDWKEHCWAEASETDSPRKGEEAAYA